MRETRGTSLAFFQEGRREYAGVIVFLRSSDAEGTF